MKKNLIFFGILTVLWACQNDYDHNYGINEPIDCSLWEYLQSDHYNFDSIVVAVRHAGLETLFEKADFTFFAITNHSVNQFLFKTVDDNGERLYQCVGDIPVELCRRMILSYIGPEKFVSTDCDFEIKGELKGGKMVETLAGNHLRCFRRTSDYDGAADKGPESFYIHDQETDRIIYVNGKNFVTTNGVIHRLSYTLQWVEL